MARAESGGVASSQGGTNNNGAPDVPPSLELASFGVTRWACLCVRA
jgi:hypothetical protein